METKRKFITALSNMTMPKARKAISLTRAKRAGIALLTAAAMLITPLGGFGPFSLDARAGAGDMNFDSSGAQQNNVYIGVGGQVEFEFTVLGTEKEPFDDFHDGAVWAVPPDRIEITYADPAGDNPPHTLSSAITNATITLAGEPSTAGGSNTDDLTGTLAFTMDAEYTVDLEGEDYILEVAVWDTASKDNEKLGSGEFKLELIERTITMSRTAGGSLSYGERTEEAQKVTFTVTAEGFSEETLPLALTNSTGTPKSDHPFIVVTPSNLEEFTVTGTGNAKTGQVILQYNGFGDVGDYDDIYLRLTDDVAGMGTANTIVSGEVFTDLGVVKAAAGLGPATPYVFELLEDNTDPNTVTVANLGALTHSDPILAAGLANDLTTGTVTFANISTKTDASDILNGQPAIGAGGTTITFTGAGEDDGTATFTVDLVSKNFANSQITITINATADGPAPGTIDTTDLVKEGDGWLLDLDVNYDDGDKGYKIGSGANQFGYGPIQSGTAGVSTEYEYGIPDAFDAGDELVLTFAAGKREAIASIAINDGTPWTPPDSWNGVRALDTNDNIAGLEKITVALKSAEVAPGKPTSFDIFFYEIAQVSIAVDDEVQGVLDEHDAPVPGEDGEDANNNPTWTTTDGVNYNFVYTNMHNDLTENGSRLALTGVEAFETGDLLALTPAMDNFAALWRGDEEVSEIGADGEPLDPKWVPEGGNEPFGTYNYVVEGPGLYEFNILLKHPIEVDDQEEELVYGDGSVATPTKITFPIRVEGVADIDTNKWYEANVELADNSPLSDLSDLGLSVLEWEDEGDPSNEPIGDENVYLEETDPGVYEGFLVLGYNGELDMEIDGDNNGKFMLKLNFVENTNDPVSADFPIIFQRDGGLFYDGGSEAGDFDAGDNYLEIKVLATEAGEPVTITLDIPEKLFNEDIVPDKTHAGWPDTSGYNIGDISERGFVEWGTDEHGEPTFWDNGVLDGVPTFDYDPINEVWLMEFEGIGETDHEIEAGGNLWVTSELNFEPFMITVKFVPEDDVPFTVGNQEMVGGRPLTYGDQGVVETPAAGQDPAVYKHDTATYTVTVSQEHTAAAEGWYDVSYVEYVEDGVGTALPGVAIKTPEGANSGKIELTKESAIAPLVGTLTLEYNGNPALNVAGTEDEGTFDLVLTLNDGVSDFTGNFSLTVLYDDGLYLEDGDGEGWEVDDGALDVTVSARAGRETEAQAPGLRTIDLEDLIGLLAHENEDLKGTFGTDEYNHGEVTFSLKKDAEGELIWSNGSGVLVGEPEISQSGDQLEFTSAGKVPGTGVVPATATLIMSFGKNFEAIEVDIEFTPVNDIDPQNMNEIAAWLEEYATLIYRKGTTEIDTGYGPTRADDDSDVYQYGIPAVMGATTDALAVQFATKNDGDAYDPADFIRSVKVVGTPSGTNVPDADETGTFTVPGAQIADGYVGGEDDIGMITVRFETQLKDEDASNATTTDYETFDLVLYEVAQVEVYRMDAGRFNLTGANGTGSSATVGGKPTYTVSGSDVYNFVHTNNHNDVTTYGVRLNADGEDSFGAGDVLVLEPKVAYLKALMFSDKGEEQVDVTDVAEEAVDPDWADGKYTLVMDGPGYYRFWIVEEEYGVDIVIDEDENLVYGPAYNSVAYNVTLGKDFEQDGLYDFTFTTVAGIGLSDDDAVDNITIEDGKGVLYLKIPEQTDAGSYFASIELTHVTKDGETTKTPLAMNPIDRTGSIEVDIAKRVVEVDVVASYVAALRPHTGSVILDYELNEDEPVYENNGFNKGIVNTNYLKGVYAKGTEVSTGTPTYTRYDADNIWLKGSHKGTAGDDVYTAPKTGKLIDGLVIIDKPAGDGRDVFSYELLGDDAANYVIKSPNPPEFSNLDTSAVIDQISISPERAILRVGTTNNTAAFTLSSNMDHFDASGVVWSTVPDVEDIEGLTLTTLTGPEAGKKAVLTAENTVVGSPTVEVVASHPATNWRASAIVQVIQTGELEVTLLESNVTVNRAKVIGAVLPIHISAAGGGGGSSVPFSTMGAGTLSDNRKQPGDTDYDPNPFDNPFIHEVRLGQTFGSPAPGYFAELNADYNLDIRTTDEQSNQQKARSIKNVKVWFLPIPTEGVPQEDAAYKAWRENGDNWIPATGVLNLKAQTVYPRITIAQPQLDRFFVGNSEAKIRPVERSGAKVTVVNATSSNDARVTARPYNDAEDSYALVSLPATSNGGATARLTLAVDGYKDKMLRAFNTKTNGNQFDRSVKVTNSNPSLSLSSGSITMKHEGEAFDDVQVNLNGRNKWTQDILSAGKVEEVKIIYDFGTKKGDVAATADETNYYYDGKDRVGRFEIPGRLGKEPGRYQVRVTFEGGRADINVRLTIKNTKSPSLKAAPTKPVLNTNLPDAGVWIDVQTNPVNLMSQTYMYDDKGIFTTPPYTLKYREGGKGEWKAVTATDPDYLSFDVRNGSIWVELVKDKVSDPGFTAKSLQLEISDAQTTADTRKAAKADTRVRLAVTTVKPTVQAKVSGRIDVLNPDSAMRVNLGFANTSARLDNVEIGKRDGETNDIITSRDFEAEYLSPTSFAIKMMDTDPDGDAAENARQGYGYGYIEPGIAELDWKIELDNGDVVTSWGNARNAASSKLKVRSQQNKVSVGRSKTSVTLFNQDSFSADRINLTLRTPQTVDANSIVTFQGGGYDEASGGYSRIQGFGTPTGLTLVQAGNQTWEFRMLGRRQLVANGNLITKNTTVKGVRLEVWPFGTYKLKNDGTPDLKEGMPQSIAGTKPAVVSVNVNVRAAATPQAPSPSNPPTEP